MLQNRANEQKNSTHSVPVRASRFKIADIVSRTGGTDTFSCGQLDDYSYINAAKSFVPQLWSKVRELLRPSQKQLADTD